MKRTGLRPTWPLLLSGAPLIIVYGASLEGDAALVALALGMGLQGGSVARFADINVKTVVITGTILKLAEAAVHRIMPSRQKGGCCRGRCRARRRWIRPGHCHPP